MQGAQENVRRLKCAMDAGKDELLITGVPRMPAVGPVRRHGLVYCYAFGNRYALMRPVLRRMARLSMPMPNSGSWSILIFSSDWMTGSVARRTDSILPATITGTVEIWNGSTFRK